ncbi:MAG: hypothetical protein KJ063_21820 [Anaerolineae bacterium]|nr:hypothetical protein [Anaerolineae bacterium]
MNISRERLAWAIILVGFAVFVLILVSVPVALNSVRLNAMRPLTIRVQANQGTVAVDDETGTRSAVFTDDVGREYEARVNLFTGTTDSGLVLFHLPNTDALVAWAQVYSNSNLTVDAAATPRFSSSGRPYRLILRLEQGRFRLTVPDNVLRPLTLQVITPQGELLINQPGQYAVEVVNVETRLVVLKGAAALIAQNQPLMINQDERGVIPLNQSPIGPLATERNLIQNGNFAQGLNHWVPLAWNIELSDQPEGEITSSRLSTEPAIRFFRLGTGHADVALRQLIDQDVADFTTLRLETTMIIHGQDVAVCGVRGSECPLTIRLEYVDTNGQNQIWQQGFYAVGEIIPNQTPDICVSCAVVQGPHQDVNLSQLAFYEIDMLTELARQGYLPPARIRSLSLIAAGHSFEVEVVNVGLLGRE